MDKQIKINPQEHYVWLVYKDGWHKLAGHIVVINGIEFSAILMPNKTGDGFELVYSILESGTRFKSIPIHFLDVLGSSTRDKTMRLYLETSKEIQKHIDRIGKIKIQNEINLKTSEVETKFGKRPDLEPFNFNEIS